MSQGIFVPGNPLFLLLLALAVFIFFITHDALQERIYRFEGYHFPLFMTLFEFTSCSIFPFIELKIRKTELSSTPLSSYMMLTLVIVPAMSLGTASLSHVSYPLKVVAKSCKLIPTMIVGTLMLGKRYGAMSYIAAGCLCLGLIGFSASDSATKPSHKESTLLGVGMLLAAVLLDSITPNFQQRLLTRGSKASEGEVMVFTNLLGIIPLSIAGVATGEFADAVAFAIAKPEVLGYLTVFSICTYFGVACYMRLVSNFSGVHAITVTTARKVVTVVLSFLIFPKPFHWGYLASGTLIVAGIVVNFVSHQREKAAAHAHSHGGLGNGHPK